MKKMVALVAPTLALPLNAEISPVPGPGDPHIQSVSYDPDQVVRVQTAPGYALTIEFSPGERIENVAVGEGSAWQVSANKRGDLLFIKQAQNAPETNLTVVTDARRYAFNLVPGYGPDPQVAYTLRFSYPTPATVPLVALDNSRTGYKLTGAKSLWPAEIHDDGTATHIRWREGQSLSAVYSVGPDRRETIVNGAMRDGYFVIDAVSPRLVLRAGRSKAVATRQTMRVKRD